MAVAQLQTELLSRFQTGQFLSQMEVYQFIHDYEMIFNLALSRLVENIGQLNLTAVQQERLFEANCWCVNMTQCLDHLGPAFFQGVVDGG